LIKVLKCFLSARSHIRTTSQKDVHSTSDFYDKRMAV